MKIYEHLVRIGVSTSAEINPDLKDYPAEMWCQDALFIRPVLLMNFKMKFNARSFWRPTCSWCTKSLGLVENALVLTILIGKPDELFNHDRNIWFKNLESSLSKTRNAGVWRRWSPAEWSSWWQHASSVAPSMGYGTNHWAFVVRCVYLSHSCIWYTFDIISSKIKQGFLASTRLLWRFWLAFF